MDTCWKLAECAFLMKFPQYAMSYKFIYCEGPKKESCVRLNYKEIHGVEPPDNLTPTGILVDTEN